MRRDILPLAGFAEEAYNVKPDIARDGVEIIFRRLNGHRVVVCRGSQGGEDWLTDARAWLTPIPDCDGFEGHDGFARVDGVWADVWADIMDEDIIYIVGHSKGGAEATILALKAAKWGKRVRLVTFGCPRVLAPDAAAWLAEHADDVVRIVNDDDPVTKVPLPVRFRHVGPPTIINRGVDLSLIRDHMMGSHYIPALIREGYR
jgi:hypothetical protein